MVVLYAMDHPERVERIVQLGPVPRKFGTEYPPGLAHRDTIPVVDSAAAARLDSLGKTDRPATHPREHCEVQRRVFAARLVGRPERAAGLMNPCAMENEWPINVQRHLQQHHFGAIQRLEVPRLLTVPGAAYQVTLDAPEFVLPAIEEFVKGRWPAGAERVRRLER